MMATALPTGVSAALDASDAMAGKGPGASTCSTARSAVALTRTTCAGSHAFVSLKITAIRIGYASPCCTRCLLVTISPRDDTANPEPLNALLSGHCTATIVTAGPLRDAIVE